MNTTATDPSKFGKDHWSLLAYLETRCVDGQYGVGVIDFRRVRCNPERHPVHAVNRTAWQSNYGTKLAGFFEFAGRDDLAAAAAAGVQLPDHDDWDCIADLEAADLLTLTSSANGLVKLTDLGIKVSAALRAHKANGGQFAEFMCPIALSSGSSNPGLG